MQVLIEIVRQKLNSTVSYIQRIPFETKDEEMRVATALHQINEGEYTDTQGNPVEPIRWESSCLQRKCGACAMVINGKPRLACDAKLKDHHKGVLRLEPLRKFPVIEDLLTDRSMLHEGLKELQVWYQEQVALDERDVEDLYESSRCIQCGCCLEICPNFELGGDFKGMAGMVPYSRILSLLSGEEKKDADKRYKRYIYAGCGKSLACHNICPMKIDIEKLLVKSNAMAVWKRMRKR